MSARANVEDYERAMDAQWRQSDIEHRTDLYDSPPMTDAEYAYAIGKLGEGALERLFGVMGGG